MKITLIVVGSLKEQYLKDMVAEYEKRLSKYCDLETIVLKDRPIGNDPQKVIKEEGEDILKKIPNNSYVVCMDEHGKMFTSVEFAHKIDEIYSYQSNNICFIIGGSLGLAKEVKDKSNMLISLSKMTFLHQFARIILLEQVYRGFKILNGETYHK